MLAAVASLAKAPAQTEVTLTNALGCQAKITHNGIASIALGGDVHRFEDLAPFLVCTTQIAGGLASHTQYWGEDLVTTRKELVQSSPLLCRVSWIGCKLPGVVGTFDLTYTYELLAGRNAVAVRGRLQGNNLAVGVQAIGYRQYLAAGDTPEAVTAGFTGAVTLRFELLAMEKWNLDHPFLLTGGRLQAGGARKEEFLTTRTGETMLIAATHCAKHRYDLLVARDPRNDPDNVGRDVGLVGSNPVGAGGSRARCGLGVISYLPNDNRAGNGGIPLDVGAGIVLDLFRKQCPTEPYWDAVRAYRERHVDPLLDGLDKKAVRPDWAERCMFMAINVSDGTVVRQQPVVAFLDEFLRYYDRVNDVALLLWGATNALDYSPMPGLAELMANIRGLEAAHNKKIHASLYYLPTSYNADALGGSRLTQVCRDPFGNAMRYGIAESEYLYLVNTGGTEAQNFFRQWLGDTFATSGVEGIYLDDALRGRHEFSCHYDTSAALQGRVPDMVRGYLQHMQAPALVQKDRYVITELGMLGRSVPGNLIQGNGGLEGGGSFFRGADEELQLLPFLNDVAGGKHYLTGYAGIIHHTWQDLEDMSGALYFATPVVRGLVPLVAPLAIKDSYQDFFQLCRTGSYDCGKPRFRPLAYYSPFMNSAADFYARHSEILARWTRQPFPGTHDIPKRVIKFLATKASPAYFVTVDETPIGCFSGPGNPMTFAVALANPLEDNRTVRLRFASRANGILLNSHYRATLEIDRGTRSEIARGRADELVCVVTLPGRSFGIVMLEPARE
jgi:hypothetical protein